MKVLKHKLFAIFSVCVVIFNVACRTNTPSENAPPIILWAWERPENLEFIDPKKYGAAFLAQTLVMKADEIDVNPRRQPLKVTDETYLIAVTRIESQNITRAAADLSDVQLEKLSTLILKTAQLKNVRAVQIDFDAAVSERSFYRRLLENLRSKLPENVPLSMTALASFCLGDNWLSGLPVSEAVPMIFRMGTDTLSIKKYLAEGNDFNSPLCRQSYGIALDEPIRAAALSDSRRIYIFNTHAWTQADLKTIENLTLK